MSDTLKKAAERLFPDPAAVSETYDPFDPTTPTLGLALVREAVGRLAWERMVYRCEACSYEVFVYLTLGVEGPPALKAARTYVACPFMVACWACRGRPRTDEERARPQPPGPTYREPLNGTMRHVGRSLPLRGVELVPDDVAYFALPHRVDRGDAGADLVIPDQALVAARRWFYEATRS